MSLDDDFADFQVAPSAPAPSPVAVNKTQNLMDILAHPTKKRGKLVVTMTEGPTRRSAQVVTDTTETYWLAISCMSVELASLHPAPMCPTMTSAPVGRLLHFGLNLTDI